MKNLREVIRQIIKDDALYKRKDLPGDIDDPDHEAGDCNCGCGTCSGKDDYVTPKYALYTMIGDAIEMYDGMESDMFDDEERNEMIMVLADKIKNLSR